MRATPSFTSRMVPSSSTASSPLYSAISFFRTEVISSGLILMHQLASWFVGQHAVLDPGQGRADAGVGDVVALADDEAPEDLRADPVLEDDLFSQTALEGRQERLLPPGRERHRGGRLDVDPAHGLVVEDLALGEDPGEERLAPLRHHEL